MQYAELMKYLGAAAAGLLILGALRAFPANAAEHQFAASDKKMAVAIEQLTVTMDEVKADNYRVPIVVVMNPNAGFTTLEFGIRSELPYEIVDVRDSDALFEIAQKSTAFTSQDGDTIEDLRWLNMIYSESTDSDSFFSYISPNEV